MEAIKYIITVDEKPVDDFASHYELSSREEEDALRAWVADYNVPIVGAEILRCLHGS